MKRSTRRIIALAAAAGLVLAACGSDDDATTTEDTTASEEVTVDTAAAATDEVVCPANLVIQTDWWPEIEHGGTYQLMMAGRSAQMLRLRLPPNDAVVPEISANKYALNVRFMLPETIARPRLAERDVAFELTFCSL